MIDSVMHGFSSLGHWIDAVPDGDLLGAIVNGLSILAAILLTGWLAPKQQDRAAKQERKERTLRILLNTWQTPANPEYQSALAVTALDFHAVKPVMKARVDYIAHVNAPAPEGDEAAAHFQKAQDLQIAIMRDGGRIGLRYLATISAHWCICLKGLRGPRDYDPESNGRMAANRKWHSSVKYDCLGHSSGTSANTGS